MGAVRKRAKAVNRAKNEICKRGRPGVAGRYARWAAWSGCDSLEAWNAWREQRELVCRMRQRGVPASQMPARHALDSLLELPMGVSRSRFPGVELYLLYYTILPRNIALFLVCDHSIKAGRAGTTPHSAA